MTALRITPHHLKTGPRTTHILKQPMRHPRRHDHDIARLDQRLDAAGVVLAAKAQPRPPGRNAQDLVRGAVEVRRRVHGVAPLGDDDAHGRQVRFDGGGGYRGREGGVVEEQRFVVPAAVGQAVVRGDAVRADPERPERCDGRMHAAVQCSVAVI